MHGLRYLAVLVSTLLVLLTSGAAASAELGATRAIPIGSQGPTCPTTDRDPGSTTPPPELQEYYLDDWRFGPEELPRRGPLGAMFEDYDRLGDYSPSEFLRCFWNDDTGGWWYPDRDGFALDDSGEPIMRPVELEAGQSLDLFGSGFGRFLAPAGTPYADRAIPPSNLNTYTERYPYSYHLYEVTRPFTVDAGPIRPWFGQPGQGLQYVLNSEYIPEAPERLTIPWLVDNGYLRQVN